MKKEIGAVAVLGCGNMGGALVRGLAKVVSATDIYVFDIDSDKAIAMNKDLGVSVVGKIQDAVDPASAVILAVKPDTIERVLGQMQPSFTKEKICISIAAGVPLIRYEEALPLGTAVIRAMPNMGAQVGMGATALALGKNAGKQHHDIATQIFESVGIVVDIEENKMDALTALSGSGPAFVLLVLEALAEAGVEQGLDSELAYKLAAQTLKGAGELFLQSGESPEVLRDRVTSKGGTTAAGLKAFEDGALTKAFSEAVRRATERSKELGNNAK